MLGISPDLLQPLKKDRVTSNVHVPNVYSWLQRSEAEDSESDDDCSWEYEDEVTVTETLSRLIQEGDSEAIRATTRPEQDRRLDNLSYASLALTLDEQTRLQVIATLILVNPADLSICRHQLPEMSEEAYEESIAGDRNVVRQMLKDLTLRPVRTDMVSIPTSTDSFSVEMLVELRQRHQTEHARHAVRTRTATSTSVTDRESPKESERNRFIREYYSALRKEQSIGISTGEGRSTRWTKGKERPSEQSNPSHLETDTADTEADFISSEISTIGGNTFNANVVAGIASKKVGFSLPIIGFLLNL